MANIKHEGLYSLNIAELESLYRLINDGTYDGNSTESIEYLKVLNNEKWRKKLTERNELLADIKEMINNKIRTILL
jgi:hypothetical protein